MEHNPTIEDMFKYETRPKYANPTIEDMFKYETRPKYANDHQNNYPLKFDPISS